MIQMCNEILTKSHLFSRSEYIISVNTQLMACAKYAYVYDLIQNPAKYSLDIFIAICCELR